MKHDEPLAALLDEFRGVTNVEAYELAFHKRLMRPDPARPGHYLGNTQREGFLQLLIPIIDQMCLGNESEVPFQIFDFGAGAGDIVDLALRRFPSAVVNLEEPNTILLNQYLAKLARRPNFSIGIKHNGPIKDYYASQANAPRPELDQDLVLGIHMLYHVTHLQDEEIDPDKDLIEAVSTMYSFLKSNGVLFLVVADQRISTSGQASRYYYQKKGMDAALENHRKIADSRSRLLLEGKIKEHLDKRFDDSQAQVQSFENESYVYGDTRADIVAICTTAETAEANEDPFDLEKLEIFDEFVETFPEKIGLTTETRDVAQKGMVRSNQQQIITIIRRIAC